MRVRKTWLLVAGLVLATGYAASGVYFVRADELGVVRRFGRALQACRRMPPGLHYAQPWPFFRVDCPKTTEVRRVYVGLAPDQREAIDQGSLEAIEATLPSDVLTGDVNILKVTVVVQYQVSDPAQYLFNTEDPDQLVHDTVLGVLIEALAGLPVDQALTTAKARLQLDTLTRSQELLARYGCGVQLVAANLESIAPPQAIIAVFQEVVGAKKDGERAIDRAIAESNRVVPRARGEAAHVRQRARGYQQTRISRALGETARFLSLLPEYRANPALFRQRLLLQTLEKVLPRIRTVVLDNKPDEPATSVKIIDTNRKKSP